MSTVLEFKDPAALIAKYDSLCESGGFFIVWLSGGETDGKNWCSYCEAAKPGINEHILPKTKLTILKGVIDDKTTWVGVKTHLYKTHPVLKATGIPTMLLIDGDAKQARVRAFDLTDDDFTNTDLLAMIADPEE